jgi:hypothetical protein
MKMITIYPPAGLRESYIIKVDGKAFWVGYSEVRRDSMLAIAGCQLTWFDKALLWVGFILTLEVA